MPPEWATTTERVPGPPANAAESIVLVPRIPAAAIRVAAATIRDIMELLLGFNLSNRLGRSNCGGRTNEQYVIYLRELSTACAWAEPGAPAPPLQCRRPRALGRVPEREGGRLVRVRDQDGSFGPSAHSACSLSHGERPGVRGQALSRGAPTSPLQGEGALRVRGTVINHTTGP